MIDFDLFGDGQQNSKIKSLKIFKKYGRIYAPKKFQNRYQKQQNF